MRTIRKVLMVFSIIIGGTGVTFPDPIISRILSAFGTSLGLAAAYLKEEETIE